MHWTHPGFNPHSLVKMSVKESVMLSNLSLYLRACCGLILPTYETILCVLLQPVKEGIHMRQQKLQSSHVKATGSICFFSGWCTLVFHKVSLPKVLISSCT